MNFSDAFKDPALCRSLLQQLHTESGEPLRFMEVCGTHTVAIFQSGLRPLLPEHITHISGPGCPVCVTHENEVAAYLELAKREQVIIATFGDLMRVPGPRGQTLKSVQADGARIEIVYAPFDALRLAAENPDATVVFLGIGFETTAPAVAATIVMARQQGLKNFQVLSFHKLVPPALNALLADPQCTVDALLLPGHVSTILGTAPYEFVAKTFHTPAAIAGFEPLDILQALLLITHMRKNNTYAVTNQYSRAVSHSGNPKARKVMYDVFQPTDALWRGLGVIPQSGLTFTSAYRQFDAMEQQHITLSHTQPTPGCKCGDVLKGKIQPDHCALFAKACTPANPVGPCMVSTEGSCAAYLKYHIGSQVS